MEQKVITVEAMEKLAQDFWDVTNPVDNASYIESKASKALHYFSFFEKWSEKWASPIAHYFIYEKGTVLVDHINWVKYVTNEDLVDTKPTLPAAR